MTSQPAIIASVDAGTGVGDPAGTSRTSVTPLEPPWCVASST